MQIVASLVSQGLVDLTRIAQAGMKVRASAGKSSFWRRETLDACLNEAREHMAEINAITPAQWAEVTQRQKAAQIPAAREKIDRTEKAIAQSSIIVGDQVTNLGNDHAQLSPMMDQIEERYETTPQELLVDGGCASAEEISKLAKRDVTVFSPVKNASKEIATGKNPYAAKPGDSAEVAQWRERM